MSALAPSPSPPPASSLDLPPTFREVLRDHQVAALHFMWDRLVDKGVLGMAARTHGSTLEQRAQLYQQVYGCVLAHSMGLGKTLTTLSFLLLLQGQVTLMDTRKQRSVQATQGPSRDRICPALRVVVVCPKSCIGHWVDSVAEWVVPRLFATQSLPVHAPSTVPSAGTSANIQRVEAMLQSFHTEGGMLILGYEEYVRLTTSLHKRSPDLDWNGERVWSILETIRQRLPLLGKVRLLDVIEGADVVVLDEAHRLKRGSSNLVKNLQRHLRNVQVRIALTGTPLQNHLEEYNVMQSIVTGSNFDTHKFNKFFVTPIAIGQCVDSSYEQFVEMQKCVMSLRKYLSTTVHYCGPEELEKALPPRKEFVFLFRLSTAQEKLYKRLVKHFLSLHKNNDAGGSALVLHHKASHICLHPALADMSSILDKDTAADGGASPTSAATGNRGDRSALSSTGDDSDDELLLQRLGAASPSEDLLARAAQAVLDESPKLQFAMRLIDHITGVLGEKVVVFSRYVSHLRFLQELIRERITDPRAEDPPNVFSGDANDVQRQSIIADFRTNPHRRVLLCSVRAGGVGINLCEANHCILLDVSWNPTDDTQATYRVFRFGQTRPVSIYRLATSGTTEQIVFAYALQKSWLHKKVVDVTDPARQERHIKRSYFTYPCQVPIDDGAPSAIVTTPSDDEKGGHGAGGEAARKRKSRRRRADMHFNAAIVKERQRIFLALCQRECPPAADVLAADPALQDTLYSVVKHSFLLRGDSDETVAGMARRFDEVKRQQQARPPIALSPTDEEDTSSGRRPGGGDGGSFTFAHCEDALVDRARTAAIYLISHVMEKRTCAGLIDTTEDTTAVTRETDRALCRLLWAVVRPVHAAREEPQSLRFQDMHALAPRRPAPPTQFTSLAELMAYLYQEGALHVMRDILSKGNFAKLRAFLTSRVPQGTGRRSRKSTLTHGLLEEALLTRPVELFRRVDPVEQTFIATEMGFVRPVVEQCFFDGVQICLLRPLHAAGGQLRSTTEPPTALVDDITELLRDYFCCLDNPDSASTTPATSDCDSGSDGDSSSSSSAEGRATRRLHTKHHHLRLEDLLSMLTRRLEDCLGELWPACHSLVLPPLPIDLALEEKRTRDAYAGAAAGRSNVGWLALPEVATALGLRPYHARRNLYTCPRCGRAPLVRSADATAYACKQCHYNAEFELKSSPLWQQAAVLFQLSFTCGLLETFSVAKSFTTSFAPSQCADVWAALLSLPCGEPLVHPIHRCMEDGVDILLSEYPKKHIQFLSLQSGAGTDANLLRRMLLANARTIWTDRLRRQVRAGLANCFRDLVGPFRLTSLTSMPLMAVILSMHMAAQRASLHLAADLLLGPSSPTAAGGEGWVGGDARAVLQMVCDSVVKLLYIERLLEHCQNKPVAESPAENADRDGSFSRSDDGDHSSLSLSDDVERVGDGATRRPRGGRAHAIQHLLREPSSSSSSAMSSSRSPPLGPRSRKRPRYGAYDDDDDSSSSSSSLYDSYSEADTQLSSSFGSRYSRDRESFHDKSSASDNETATAADGAERKPHPWRVEEDEEDVAKTHEQLEDEATLQQRSAQYWVAYCEVYGTRSAETLTVFVEDEEFGMTILPPPPPIFWVSHLAKASKDGRTIAEVIELFFEKVLDLSQRAKLIRA